jgi:hypothetical protein
MDHQNPLSAKLLKINKITQKTHLSQGNLEGDESGVWYHLTYVGIIHPSKK